MEEQIAKIKKSIDELKVDPASMGALDAEAQARVSLGLAFTLNSLFYSMLRAQGKVKLIEQHTALSTQTESIKARFVKLAEIVRKRDAKTKRTEERQQQIETTQRMVKNALKVRPDRNLLSSSDDEVKVLKKRKRDEVQMHGATVVPQPAFLKHRKLLDK
jgi:hypothetical protein